jgi:hypothetical protein
MAGSQIELRLTHRAGLNHIKPYKTITRLARSYEDFGSILTPASRVHILT